MSSPPKPWERNGVQTSATPVISTPSSMTTAPSVSERPASLVQNTTSSVALTQTPYNPMASSYTSPYSSPYGATSYGASSYASPYNRFGSGYGATSAYGGYGGYGGGMGGYGGGYGGYGGMNPYGMPGGGIDPMTGQPSLIQQVESSTSQTFALIQSIVGTFTGFAQMLDSTFMATHSSFFAMLGVAEQFGQLRMALGQVFGLFGFVGWLRGWYRGDRGRFKDDFKRFMKGEDVGGSGAPKPSKKPLIVFLVAVFGLPYLMHRLIKHIASRLPPPPPVQFGPDGRPLPQQQIDPANLTFARAVYPFETKDPVELALAKGELVAVLQQTDPATGAESEWWQGRTREGRQGWFPRAYVEVVKQKKIEGEGDVASLPPGKAIA
ncbi:Peroxisomal membrane protein PAS20 [Tulasnella sp. JGI-2019a]|nr:Peroxisomal membrane protein PAS20 [Tulasnella sp. JGI-2019a]